MGRPPAHASVFHAIADPTRRAILDMLRDGERTVTALLEPFRLSQPAVSQHLAVLRRARLVRVRKDGRRRIYSMDAAPLAEVARWITGYDRFWSARAGRAAPEPARRKPAARRPRA